MIGVIIDIDDTLIDSEMRMHALMEYLMERDIPYEDMQSLTIQKKEGMYQSWGQT